MFRGPAPQGARTEILRQRLASDLGIGYPSAPTRARSDAAPPWMGQSGPKRKRTLGVLVLAPIALANAAKIFVTPSLRRASLDGSFERDETELTRK
ncbi:MAG TPA: hypothetical protein VIM73_22005 [Polyangiaceae bacterium]